MLTDVKLELQALLVVHYLDGDASRVKEKIDAGMDEEDLKKKEGIKNLLDFLATVYKVDALANSFEKDMRVENLRRKPSVAKKPSVARKVGWSPSCKKINQPQLEDKEGAETQKNDGMEDLKEVVMLLIGSRVGLQQNESDDFEALIDSACPRTVSGTKWIDLYISKHPKQMKQRVRWETSKSIPVWRWRKKRIQGSHTTSL